MYSYREPLDYIQMQEVHILNGTCGTLQSNQEQLIKTGLIVSHYMRRTEMCFRHIAGVHTKF